MEAAILEFHVPQRPDELEDSSTLPRGAYVVQNVLPLADVDSGGMMAEFSSATSNMVTGGPQSVVVEPVLFDTIYSILKAASQLDAGDLCTLQTSLSEFLETACSHAELFLAGGQQTDSGERAIHRNTIKMLGWLLARFLAHGLKSGADRGSGPTPESPAPISRAPIGRKKGARSKAVGKDNNMGLERALKALNRTISREVSPLFPQSDPDENYVQSLLKLAVILMEPPENLRSLPGRGGVSPLRDSIFELLACIIARYAVLTEVHKQQSAIERQAQGGASQAEAGDERPAGEEGRQGAAAEVPEAEEEKPIDLCLAPLVDLVKQKEHMPRHLAGFCKHTWGQGFTWASVFAEALMHAVVEEALRLRDGDAAQGTARNLGAFVSDLADVCPGVMAANTDLLYQLLQSDAMTIRKCAVEGMTQIIAEHFEKGGQEVAKVSEMQDIVMERCMDVSHFVRMCALRKLRELLSSGKTQGWPHERVLEVAMGRLSDRTSLVRAAAAQTSVILVSHNRWGPSLKLSVFMTEFTKKFAEFIESRPDADQGDLEREAIAFEAAARGEGDLSRWSEADQGILSALTYRRLGVRYIELCHSLTQRAVSTLLPSPTPSDVVEGIKLITALIGFQVEEAISVIPRVLQQVFSREEVVMDAVMEAARRIFVGVGAVGVRESPSEQAPYVLTQILRILSSADDGTVAAIEQIVVRLGTPFTTMLLGCTWLVVTGLPAAPGFPRPTVTERSSAIRVYSMLLTVYPDEGESKWDDLVRVVLSEAPDVLFQINGCNALRKAAIGRSEGRLSCRSPIFGGLAGLLFGAAPSVGLWVQLARQAVQTIYDIADDPEQVAQAVIKRLWTQYDKQKAALDAVRPDPLSAEESTKGAEEGGTSPEGETAPPLAEEAPVEKTPKAPVAEGSDFKDRLHECSFALTRLLVCLGETALKQLVHFDRRLAATLKSIEQEEVAERKPGKKERDAIVEELGMQSRGFKETEAEERHREQEAAMFNSDTAWGRGKRLIVDVCSRSDHTLHSVPEVRTSGVMALCALMLVNQEVARKHVSWLFLILKSSDPSTRRNIIVALGDLFWRWPNLLEKKTPAFLSCLRDPDARTRRTGYLIASNLVLGDMIKTRRVLHRMCAGLEDTDAMVRGSARVWLCELHAKDKDRIYQILPDCLSALSSDEVDVSDEAFVRIMQQLLENISREKHLDGLVQRLCAKFANMKDEGDLGDEMEEEDEKGEKQRPPSDALRQRNARRVALVLGMLDVKHTSERALKRLTSDNCFKLYEPYLADTEVFESLASIAQKAKRPPPGTREKEEVKQLLEAWEQRLDEANERLNAERKARKRAMAEEEKAAKVKNREKDRPGTQASQKEKGRKNKRRKKEEEEDEEADPFAISEDEDEERPKRRRQRRRKKEEDEEEDEDEAPAPKKRRRRRGEEPADEEAQEGRAKRRQGDGKRRRREVETQETQDAEAEEHGSPPDAGRRRRRRVEDEDDE
eukprot:Hpha_TRINITY_DN15078_c7_g2::TRINITY_DN15078_c7_g2_i1::g.123644::m.123644/K06677/YCS4, CNAP1, CAPD2; condensin complex subunit 1